MDTRFIFQLLQCLKNGDVWCQSGEAGWPDPAPGWLLSLFGMGVSHSGQVSGNGARRGWKPRFSRCNAIAGLLPDSWCDPQVSPDGPRTSSSPPAGTGRIKIQSQLRNGLVSQHDRISPTYQNPALTKVFAQTPEDQNHQLASCSWPSSPITSASQISLQVANTSFKSRTHQQPRGKRRFWHLTRVVPSPPRSPQAFSCGLRLKVAPDQSAGSLHLPPTALGAPQGCFGSECWAGSSSGIPALETMWGVKQCYPRNGWIRAEFCIYCLSSLKWL